MSLRAKPLVSIGIPTYNRPDGLRRALDGAIRQNYQDIEIIVSDNCSSDPNVLAVMEDYCRKDKRVRYYRQTSNLGALANFKFVLSQAKGKYFAWHADDDLCKSEMVSTLVPPLESNPNVVLCACDVEVIDERGNRIRVEHLAELHAGDEWRKTRRKFFLYPTSNIFFAVYGLFRTEVIRRQGERLWIGWRGYGTNMEVPFLALIATMGEIVAVPQVLRSYRSHEESGYVKEIATISWLDVFRLRLFIRYRLFRIAIESCLPLREKIAFFGAIVFSLLKRQPTAISQFISRFVPLKLVNWLKNKKRARSDRVKEQ